MSRLAKRMNNTLPSTECPDVVESCWRTDPRPAHTRQRDNGRLADSRSMVHPPCNGNLQRPRTCPMPIYGCIISPPAAAAAAALFLPFWAWDCTLTAPSFVIHLLAGSKLTASLGWDARVLRLVRISGAVSLSAVFGTGPRLRPRRRNTASTISKAVCSIAG